MSNISFNETFYLSTYPDVAAAVSRGVFASGAQHYQLNGRFEGRNPNQFFNTSEYLGRYTDVARAGVNPLTHFLTSGAAEGRFANSNEDAAIDQNNNDIADDFNATDYLARYVDVAAQTGAGRPFATAYQHFVLFGQFEGRTAVTTGGVAIAGPFVNGGTGGGTPSTGTTSQLTTGADNIVGTNGNDVINGFISATATLSTLTAADQINGGAGTDTLNVTTEAGGNVLGGASLTSIEVVGIRAAANANNTLDATGLTGVNLSGTNTGTTTLTALANNAVVTVGAGANLTGTISATYVDAATTATLAYAGGTTGAATVVGTGITTANLSSTGAANTAGVITVAGATTINITAASNLTATSIQTTGLNSTLNVAGTAAAVNVGLLDSDLRTINASGLTAGGLTATLSNAAQVITGGAGNDVIGTGGLGLLTGSVNAGAGTGDRLVLTATADLATAAQGARYTGFEILQVENGQTANLDNIAGITGIRINDAAGATAVTNLSAAQAGAITIVAANATGAIDIGVKNAANVGQVDTVALTIDDQATTVGTLALGTPVLTGVEKLTINAVDNYTIAALTAATSLDSITLTGAATQGITFGVGPIAANFAVNGAAATGVLTIDATGATVNGASITGGTANDVLTGSAQADILTGGAGNDTLSGLAGADQINGGDGNDNITGGVGADILSGGAGVDTFVYTTLTDSIASAPDRISDLVAGTDKIDVTTVPTTVQQGAAYTAAGTGTLATDIGTAIAAGGALAVNGAAVVTITGTGAGTYLVLGDGTLGYAAADDAVINITGLTGTLAVSDFV